MALDCCFYSCHRYTQKTTCYWYAEICVQKGCWIPSGNKMSSKSNLFRNNHWSRQKSTKVDFFSYNFHMRCSVHAILRPILKNEDFCFYSNTRSNKAYSFSNLFSSMLYAVRNVICTNFLRYTYPMLSFAYYISHCMAITKRKRNHENKPK